MHDSCRRAVGIANGWTRFGTVCLLCWPGLILAGSDKSNAGTQAPKAAGTQVAEDTGAPVLEIVSVKKIWDQAPHNAFTDLARYQDKWYCTFREGRYHAKSDGKVRVLTSTDGEKWEPAALLVEKGIDLRDPKLSVTPDGRLMIVAGGSVYKDKKFIGRQPRVAFSKDGRNWTPTQRVLSEGEWLWRVTWYRSRAYGTSRSLHTDKEDSVFTLWTSDDGLHYELITRLDVPDRANETTLRFLPNGDMLALVRREGGNRYGWIGKSSKPYEQWKWHETGHRLGGPNFICLPDGSMWAASRTYSSQKRRDWRTALARFGPETYEPVLTLPSGGDCSYPGLVWHEGMLWMSYYSSHEGKTSIYLAKIRFTR